MKGPRTISARQILAGLSAGLTARELAARFGLPLPQLQPLIDRLLQERRTRALRILTDVRSGLSVQEIAGRNGFPAEKFGVIMERIKELGTPGSGDICDPDAVPDPEHSPQDRRSSPRLHVPVLTTRVYEATSPESTGQIMDLSELGLRIRGLRAHVDEVKTLVMNVGDFAQLQVLTLECQCRWVSGGEGTPETGCSGFQITSISDECLGFLQTILAHEFALGQAS